MTLTLIRAIMEILKKFNNNKSLRAKNKVLLKFTHTKINKWSRDSFEKN